ncbi:LysR family transcriptional regulator [Thorsellia kenyensis]|uniref:LysR family transcriptional regulator n=1 Tax=Thorsellia kenyensis TaxID=1549888 RepID=A0ABV6CH05_9GAMM
MLNLSRFDPQLLYLFYILYKERNASRAAEILMISQPGLAHKLNKMRLEWQDPLFIKVPRGLSPTPKAHELAPKVSDLVQKLSEFYQTLSNESFLNRQEKIFIFTTDYMEQKLLPLLLPIVAKEAPNLTIITQNTQGKLPKKLLEQGAADIAIAGFYQDLPDSYRQQKVLEESFVVVASKNNQLIERELTLEKYVACQHIVTTLNGDLFTSIDAKLSELSLKRQIIAGISSFFSSAQLIKNSDLIVTCLRSIAEQFVANDDSLIIYELPLVMPKIKIMQIWHERTQEDPLREWLRKTIKSCLEVK